jgi:two-component system OmpR family sensor kinase/two-component system sensor histidine kinase BaeS
MSGRHNLRFDIKLFWQLLFAFVITASVISIGIYVSGITAFRRIEMEFISRRPALAQLWSDRLGRYYAEEGDWSGLAAMVDSYPLGEAWAPWDDSWALYVMVTDVNHRVIYSSDPARVGQSLSGLDSAWALTITANDETVGYLSMPWLLPSALSPEADHVVSVVQPSLDVLRRALRRLVLTEAVVVLLGLMVGATLSRRISQPVTEVASAASRIAAGDLSARVPGTPRGELGDLARSFNQMAAALQRSDELRRNMTADVAHDLRTPLSVIRGKLEGIMDGIYPATEAHILPVLEETEVLTQLVEDLRLLALAEARQLTLDLRSIDIGGVLRDAQVNFSPLAQDRGIALVLDLPGVLPDVVADRQRISQVLGNLITNALRHTPSGGMVTLSATVAESNLIVTVRDSGIGIGPDELPYVFERFWRGERSRSRESGGSGLGLAIARELVVLHGGTIEAESVPGKGATFRFSLPLARVDVDKT